MEADWGAETTDGGDAARRAICLAALIRVSTEGENHPLASVDNPRKDGMQLVTRTPERAASAAGLDCCL